jgi:hypothetical protein
MTPGLIERLEAAEGGSRELDREIARECGWTNLDVPTFWVKSVCDAAGFPPGTAQATPLPHYTTSLDAALALAERVLPDEIWTCEFGPSSSHAEMKNARFIIEGVARTPALALTAAILKARATQEQG